MNPYPLKNPCLIGIAALLVSATGLTAELWTNALGNNDFADWGNWVRDASTELPTSWTAASQNWQVNRIGADRAVLGPQQVVIGLDRNVLVGDAESQPVGTVGELLIDGGRLEVTRNMRLGRDTITGYGEVTVQNGGILRLGYGLYIGQSFTAGGVFSLADGLVEVTTNASRSDGLLVGHREGGNGTLNISGGILQVIAGDAVFCEGGNAGTATAALNLSGDGQLLLNSGRLGLGGNGGGVNVSVTIADQAVLQIAANSARVGFGADSRVVLNISGGLLDVSQGFLTFGQGAGATVDVAMSGGELRADRIIFANIDTATASFAMSGGRVVIARSGTSTSSSTGGLRLAAGNSQVLIHGDAVLETEKFWIKDNGVLVLAGTAQIQVLGSTDATHPTFDFTLAAIAAGEVVGRMRVNGGSFTVNGKGETYPDPATEGASIEVNFAELLNAAIAAGIIGTEIEDATLLAEYDTDADVTRLRLQSAGPPVSIWSALAADEYGFRETGIGPLVDEFYPFVYHLTSGWIYLVAASAALDGFHAYDYAAEAWLWSADHVSGWRYNYTTAEWQAW